MLFLNSCIFKGKLKFPLTYVKLKEFAELAYHHVERRLLDLNEEFQLGVLTHATAPISSSHSLNAKFFHVINTIDQSFEKKEDVTGHGVDLVVFPKSLADRSHKSIAGSSFHKDSMITTAAVAFANSDLRDMRTHNGSFPEYLNSFEISPSLTWKEKREAFIALYKDTAEHNIHVGPKIVVENDVKESLKSLLMNYKGNANELPAGIKLKRKVAATNCVNSSLTETKKYAGNWLLRVRNNCTENLGTIMPVHSVVCVVRWKKDLLLKISRFNAKRTVERRLIEKHIVGSIWIVLIF